MTLFGFSVYGSVEYGSEPTAIHLDSAVPQDPIHILVTFDQVLDLDSILSDPASYTINGGLEVVSVDLASPQSIILTVGPPMAQDQLYTLTVVGKVNDFFNHLVIALGYTTAQFLGYRINVVSDATFNYDLYKFFIKAIRDDDTKLGTELLKRLLMGPQEAFDQTNAKIKSMLRLSNYLDSPAEYLPDLLQLVGFTGDPATFGILNGLSVLDQRRLLWAAVKIWKAKGTELSYEKIATLLGGIRLEIDDWFYFRWIVFGDETDAVPDGVIGEDRLQGDSWIVSSPGEVNEPDEYQSDIVIMDEPDLELDRDLVVNMLKLARPSGERLDVCFFEYFDHFADISDVETVTGLSSLATGGGLSHGADNTLTVTNVVYAKEWINTYAAWQLLISQQVKADTDNKFRLVFHYTNPSNYDYLEVSLGAGTGTAAVSLGRRFSGVESELAVVSEHVDFDSAYNYIWRVQCLQYHVPGTTTARQQIRVLKDQDQILLFDESIRASTLVSGTVGEMSFKARIMLKWKEVFQAPLTVHRIRPALRVEPRSSNVAPYGNLQFIAGGGGGGYGFSLVAPANGSITPDGYYTAGATVGSVDYITLKDRFNNQAKALVEVEVPTP
jgi:hypothetical protein